MTVAEPARLDAAAHGNLLVSVVRFCRLLRQWGVPVAAGASQAAIEALREISLARREDFRHALALTLVHRPEDMPLFLYLFNAFWGSPTHRAPGTLGEEEHERPAPPSGLHRHGARGA